jgi:membrane-associated protease RseP (regulator of RpoE activity)
MTQIILFVALVLIAMIVHEAGHAFAMRRKGMTIKEVGLGFPTEISLSGRVFTPAIKVRLSKFFPNTTFALHPALFGAYVEPYYDPASSWEELAAKFSYKDQALIHGAGVLGNIMLSLVLFVLAILPSVTLNSFVSPIFYAIVVGTLLTIVFLWKLARIFCAYVIPFLGIGATAIFGTTLIIAFKALFTADVSSENEGIQSIITNLATFLFVGSFTSLFLGLFNAIPIFPLDGGRIADAILFKFSEKYSKLFQKAGKFIFTAVTLVSLVYILLLLAKYS